MSKISIFKYNLNGQNSDNITNIILEYLSSRGFIFDQEKNFYVTGKPNNTANDIATSVGLSVAASLVTGGTAITIVGIQRGFEFYINGNDLIIKAYLYNAKNKSKQMIHSTFNNSRAAALYYVDLKNALFNRLKESNITLMNTEEEHVNDGSGLRTVKTIFTVFGIIVVLAAIFIYIAINYL